jgi:hypothetical protein
MKRRGRFQMSKKLIWFIDENDDQLKSYQQKLRRAIDKSVDIYGIMPYPTMEEYCSKVLCTPGTVAIIIDQRLKDTGVVNYEGIELAKYIRGIATKLPIYILTNYPTDDVFEDNEWSVEYVIDKADLSDATKTTRLASRIIRHIDVYEDILADREARFHELLVKSLDSKLSASEKEELRKVNAFRASPILAQELKVMEQLDKCIQTQKRILGKRKIMRVRK